MLTLGCLALLAQLPHLSLAIDSNDSQTDAKQDDSTKTDSADTTTDTTTEKTSAVDVNEHK